jgi:hypothetical protein
VKNYEKKSEFNEAKEMSYAGINQRFLKAASALAPEPRPIPSGADAARWAERRRRPAAQRIATAGPSPRLAFPCAGRGYARRLGGFRRPCAEHRVHDLANIRRKNCFAENQESLELVEIGNS